MITVLPDVAVHWTCTKTKGGQKKMMISKEERDEHIHICPSSLRKERGEGK